MSSRRASQRCSLISTVCVTTMFSVHGTCLWSTAWGVASIVLVSCRCLGADSSLAAYSHVVSVYECVTMGVMQESFCPWLAVREVGFVLKQLNEVSTRRDERLDEASTRHNVVV
jgi:hypothetical protein